MNTDESDLATLHRAEAVTQRDLAAVFDTLGPVTMSMLAGSWRADPSYSETPGGALLIRGGWWGARFTDTESVDPLLFPDAAGRGVFAADLVKVLTLLSSGVEDISTRRRDVETTAPIGRVRMVEYRGLVSAALIYDQVPVLDYLRAVDQDTIVAAVEGRGMADQPAFVRLHRSAEP